MAGTCAASEGKFEGFSRDVGPSILSGPHFRRSLHGLQGGSSGKEFLTHAEEVFAGLVSM